LASMKKATIIPRNNVHSNILKVYRHPSPEIEVHGTRKSNSKREKATIRRWTVAGLALEGVSTEDR